LIEYSKRSLPIMIASMVMSGATGPVTLAGSLVQHNAEVLSGVVLSQAVQPGTPNIYSSASCILDMRTGVPSIGSPEAAMFQAAIAQLAQYYGLPTRGSSLASDSKSPDPQSSYEKAIGAVLGCLSGLNLNTWAGVLEYYMTISPIQLVIDSENWSGGFPYHNSRRRNKGGRVEGGFSQPQAHTGKSAERTVVSITVRSEELQQLEE